MIKWIKKLKYRAYRKKRIQLEVLETLGSICGYIVRDASYNRQRDLADLMYSHFSQIRTLTAELREELRDEKY